MDYIHTDELSFSVYRGYSGIPFLLSQAVGGLTLIVGVLSCNKQTLKYGLTITHI
jgi:hypothetical protein